ncbi:hypothetical protein, partial [Salmonella enterica]|uniref:hypothetical protein n=1 Tax=Salmonella enterica TaxID=28901 RepID=UPI0020C267FA
WVRRAERGRDHRMEEPDAAETEPSRPAMMLRTADSAAPGVWLGPLLSLDDWACHFLFAKRK